MGVMHEFLWFYRIDASLPSSIYTLLYMYHLYPVAPFVFAQMGHHFQLGDRKKDKSDSNSWPSNGQGLAHEELSSLNLSRLNVAHASLTKVCVCDATISCNWNHLDGGTSKLLVNMLLYSNTTNNAEILGLYTL